MSTGPLGKKAKKDQRSSGPMQKMPLAVIVLTTAVALSGCTSAEENSEAQQSGGGSPGGPASAIPTTSPDVRREPLPEPYVNLCSGSSFDECFSFVWIVGEESQKVIDAPEDQPPPRDTYCGRPAPEDRNFVHSVDLETETIHYAGHRPSPMNLLLVFDHWQGWNGCGVPYALVEDIVGRVPITMGRGGTYWFQLDADEFSVQFESVDVGTKALFSYTATEERGPYRIEYGGQFEVRNYGQWPVSALKDVE